MSNGARHAWQIGDIEFLATKDNGGWWYLGIMGGMTVFKEEYHHGSIRQIISESVVLVRGYALGLLSDAETFDPSDAI